MQIRQAMAELRGCSRIIENEDTLYRACEEGAREVGAKIIGRGAGYYQPHGYTVIIFLAESHILITTWPEYDLALVDVLLCNPDMDPGVVIAKVKEILCPDGEVSLQQITRKISPKNQ